MGLVLHSAGARDRRKVGRPDGVNIPPHYSATFIIGSALAAIAGVLVSSNTASPTTTWDCTSSQGIHGRGTGRIGNLPGGGPAGADRAQRWLRRRSPGFSAQPLQDVFSSGADHGSGVLAHRPKASACRSAYWHAGKASSIGSASARGKRLVCATVVALADSRSPRSQTYLAIVDLPPVYMLRWGSSCTGLRTARPGLIAFYAVAPTYHSSLRRISAFAVWWCFAHGCWPAFSASCWVRRRCGCGAIIWPSSRLASVRLSHLSE